MLLRLCKGISCSHDCRSYIPELLPKFVSLLADAERTGNYEMVRLEVWGCVGRVGGLLGEVSRSDLWVRLVACMHGGKRCGSHRLVLQP